MFVTEFLRHYLAAQPRFADFGAYLAGEGKSFIRVWCGQHREIPDFNADKNYYYDWTAMEVFSLAGPA